MKIFSRWIKHLLAARWQVTQVLPAHSMRSITSAIQTSEKLHQGELRFVVEAGLDLPELWQGIKSRERALQVFSSLRVWDTEHNSGVLIYLLLADRKVEVIADRGISKLVPQTDWERICRNMEAHFRKGEFEQGILLGIREISSLLQRYFPASGEKQNELPDQPVVL